MAGTLYVVPTPVGNMGDMSPRAVDVLRSVATVYAEDTRTTSVLFRHFGIATPLASFHKFNEHEVVDRLMAQLNAGADIAIVSDAGTPGISDPGFLIARECRLSGVNVITLPGPTAFVPALVDSGLPCDRFFFEGFLPQKKGRRTRLEFLAALPVTFIVYESPLRLERTLAELAEVCSPQRPASVTREISKIHETTVAGTLQELKDYFHLNPPRGEIVIIVGGNSTTEVKVHRNKYKDNV